MPAIGQYAMLGGSTFVAGATITALSELEADGKVAKLPAAVVGSGAMIGAAVVAASVARPAFGTKAGMAVFGGGFLGGLFAGRAAVDALG
jgi:hypothetical protein